MHERSSGTHIPDRFFEGHGGHVPDAIAEEYLYGAISPGAADGGGAVSGGATAEQEPRDGRDSLHRMQLVHPGVSGKPDCRGMGTRRGDTTESANHVYV